MISSELGDSVNARMFQNSYLTSLLLHIEIDPMVTLSEVPLYA